MFFSKIKDFFIKLLLKERDPSRLALTFCLSNLIAWSATVPFQTPLLLIVSRIVGFDYKIMFAVSFIINNPFTLIPIYMANYSFGAWFFHNIFKIDMIKYNPSWTQTFSNYLNKYIDLSKIIGTTNFCFWCLILGSLILPLIINIFLYPILKKLFSYLLKKYIN